LNTLLEYIFRGCVKDSSHKINNISELHKSKIIIIKKKLGVLEAREESGVEGGGEIASGADLRELSDIMEPDVTRVQNYWYLEVLESG